MKRSTVSVFALAVLVAGLTGCTNKHIATVKAMPFDTDVDSTMTVDQALDHRGECDSIKWNILTTDRNQTVIEYRCYFKGFADSNIIKNDLKTDQTLNSVADLRQWTIDPDGKPQLNFAGIEWGHSDGKMVTQAWGSLVTTDTVILGKEKYNCDYINGELQSQVQNDLHNYQQESKGSVIYGGAAWDTPEVAKARAQGWKDKAQKTQDQMCHGNGVDDFFDLINYERNIYSATH